MKICCRKNNEEKGKKPLKKIGSFVFRRFFRTPDDSPEPAGGSPKPLDPSPAIPGSSLKVPNLHQREFDEEKKIRELRE
ncbi:MAG: hypothetical protein LBK63_08945 [Treponema sp.]|jgi:hypothetical protein|nr:hypothetical protein [Treponema sp.]